MAARHPYVINMTGQVFGRLTVVEYAGARDRRESYWLCRCECGSSKTIRGTSLRRGDTVSCGCFHSERASQTSRRHGESHKTAEYICWKTMRQRCLNASCREFRNYGGRGITICDRWLVGENGIHPFECFLADMGRRPSPEHSIDRKDVNGNYEPGNCRWATEDEQRNNLRTTRRVSYRDHEMSLAQAIRAAGCIATPEMAWKRLKMGWPVDKAVETPSSRSIPECLRRT